RGPGYTFFLTPTEAVMAIRKGGGSANASRVRASNTAGQQSVESVLRVQPVGGNPLATATGVSELAGKTNSLVGSDARQWRTDIPTYSEVDLQDVYPGIDLAYHGNGQALEYDLRIAPGANPKAISLALKGADRMELDAQGNLV